jgi:SAM-dependent methyltransferase
MDYSERLKYFNSTDKYRRELKFLLGMIDYGYSEILDYGCGIGTAIHYIYDTRKEHGKNVIVRGYDINNYFKERPNWLLDGEPQGQYHHITFIHSLAHIENVREVLISLKDNLVDKGKISVITPNKEWIDLVGDTKSDPTVKEHFTSKTLSDLFMDCEYKQIQSGQFGERLENQHERLFIQVEK